MRTSLLIASLALLTLGAGCGPMQTTTTTNSTSATNSTTNDSTAVIPMTDIIALNAPFSTQVYDLSSGSSFLANLEIMQNGESQAMYTQVFTPAQQSAVSFDRTAIFIGRYQQQEGLETEYYIVHPETGDATLLENQSCLGEDGYWQGNTLITYATSTLDEGGILPTDICFWDTTGTLLGNTQQPLYWSAAASAPYLSDAVGIIPNAPQPQAWIYTRTNDETECTVHIFAYEDEMEVTALPVPESAPVDDVGAHCRPAKFQFEYSDNAGVRVTPIFYDTLQDPSETVRFQGGLD